MNETAPGKGLLKLTSVLYLIGSLASIAIAVSAIAAGGLLSAAQYEMPGAYTLSVMFAGNGALILIGALLDLVAGILGLKNANHPEKCGVNFVLGIIMVLLNVALLVFHGMNAEPGAWSVWVSGGLMVLISVLYWYGAKKNKDAAKG